MNVVFQASQLAFELVHPGGGHAAVLGSSSVERV